MKFILLSFIVINSANANWANFLTDKLKITKPSIPKKKIKKHEDQDLKVLLENSKQMKALLEANVPSFYIYDVSKNINSGSVFKGVLLNSVVSSNLETPLMVMSYSDQGLPYKTKFLCRGISLNERVQAQCFRMISGDNEKEISAQLLNPDGTAGLLGEVDDRKEEAMTQILSQDFVRGILGASKERVMTGLGEVTKTNFKNQMLGGAIEATEKSSELFAEDYKNLPVIIILNAGMEVLIYFNEGVNQ